MQMYKYYHKTVPLVIRELFDDYMHIHQYNDNNNNNIYLYSAISSEYSMFNALIGIRYNVHNNNSR